MLLRAVEKALQPSKALQQWFFSMLLGEIYFKSHILFLAPSICLSPYALQLFWSLAMQKTKLMHKHKHEYALICRAWCPFIVRAAPSGCL